jgi:hypothetical protein
LRLAFSALAVVTSAIMYRNANLHAKRARIQSWHRLHGLWNVPGRCSGQTKPIHD